MAKQRRIPGIASRHPSTELPYHTLLVDHGSGESRTFQLNSGPRPLAPTRAKRASRMLYNFSNTMGTAHANRVHSQRPGSLR
jgi:hypothetical protein